MMTFLSDESKANSLLRFLPLVKFADVVDTGVVAAVADVIGVNFVSEEHRGNDFLVQMLFVNFNMNLSPEHVLMRPESLIFSLFSIL